MKKTEIAVKKVLYDKNSSKKCKTANGSALTQRNAKIIPMGGITKLDIPPDRILKKAIGQLNKVLIIGFDKDGDLYCASSVADGGDVIWFLEACKQKLFESI